MGTLSAVCCAGAQANRTVVRIAAMNRMRGMLHARPRFRDCLMKIGNVIAVTLLVAATAGASERPFTASSVPNAKLKKPGKVVITNDKRSITAYHFFGNIREEIGRAHV